MWGRRRAEENDLAEELRAHLETEIAQLMEQGRTRAEAELEAQRKFGSLALVTEVTLDARPFTWLERLWQDLRYAARILRRSPGFTAATVLSLVLGIGASTAVFSVADTIFLRPLPYPDSARLMFVGITFPGVGQNFVPSPDYVAWRRDSRMFEQLAATRVSGADVMLRGGSEPMEIRAAKVSYNFLRTLAVTPALGRDFRPEEELPDGPRAVLLTDRFWREQFHARRDAVGSVLQLDGQPYTVAGVLPPSFVLPVDYRFDVLTTLPISPTASYRDRSIATWFVYGRLRPGVTLAQGRAELGTLFGVTKADVPKFFRADNKLVVEPLQQHRIGDSRLLILVLTGAAACLLLIACANVANLLLARWSSRAREMAVRAAIGASRGRLIRQLLAETALLTAMGWVGGTALVTLALRAFAHFAAGELPRMAEVGVDGRVLAIALLVSALTALIFAAIPVLRTGRADIQMVLQAAGRRGVSGGHRLLRRSLVAAEVALSIILLTGAALMIQTLRHLENDHLGFLPDHALAVNIPLRGLRQPLEAWLPLGESILPFLQRLPGTDSAAIAQCTPLTGGMMLGTFSRSDRPLPEPFHRGDNISICGVGPDYFRAAGAHLVRGRVFTADDFRDAQPLAVINEAAAHTYFPGEDPVGKQILGARSIWKTVVGVVADTKNVGLSRAAAPQAFLNDLTPIQASEELQYLVRTAAEPKLLAAGLRDELRAHHPGLFAKVQTLDEAIGERTIAPRFNSILLASFAAVAFLMAIVGVYGVLAFSVSERTQEIGIRMALGASPSGVLAEVVREGMLLTIAGSAIGLAAAMVLTRYLKSLLYGISAHDPLTMVAVVVALTLAAVVASVLPARRAAKVDPMAALRL